jgi:hypothetical protein
LSFFKRSGLNSRYAFFQAGGVTDAKIYIPAHIRSQSVCRFANILAGLVDVAVLAVNTYLFSDDATITSAALTVTRQGKAGYPSTLGDITVDIKNGYYGTSSTLATEDFQGYPSQQT